MSGSAPAIFEPYAADRDGVLAIGVCLESVSSTLGMPDSIYAWFDIVSNTCHPVPFYLNSDKIFLTLGDQCHI